MTKGRKWIACCAVAVLLGVGVSVYDYDLANPGRYRVRGDFADYSLAAAEALRARENPYRKANLDGRNYKYFPLNAVVYLPLTYVPLPVAQGIWVAGNVVLLVFAVAVHRDFLPNRRVHPLVWVAALAVAARFFFANINLGQWNLPVYSLSVLGLWLIVTRGRTVLGSVLVGLAAGLKFMPAGFALYFLVRRRWAAAAGIVLAAGFWILVFPSLVLGPQRHMGLLGKYTAVGRRRAGHMIERDKVSGHSLLAAIKCALSPTWKDAGHRVTGRTDVVQLPHRTAKNIALAVCVGLAGAACWACSRPAGADGDGFDALLGIGLVFTLLLLVSPEVRKAHLLTVFTPAFALAVVWRHGARGRDRWLALMTLLFAILCVFVSSRRVPRGIQKAFLLTGILTWMVLALFLCLLWFCWRQKRGDGSVPFLSPSGIAKSP